MFKRSSDYIKLNRCTVLYKLYCSIHLQGYADVSISEIPVYETHERLK